MSKNGKMCFVIMPFSQTTEKHTEKYWNNHFQHFMKPLIEEHPELEAYRSEPLRGDILKQIITNLVVAPVVVADLTDLNPNVFWELGVRQSHKHGTVTIAQKGTALPFDVSVKGTLFYHPDNHIENAKFCKDFKKAIMNCLTNPDSPDSSVLETLSGRGTFYEIIHHAEATRRMVALIEECTWNADLLITIQERIKENRKNPKEREWVTSRFRSSAVELLLTERYLDEDESLYETIEVCFVSVHALNDMLRTWALIEQGENVEEWFEEHMDLYLKRFEEHKMVLTNAQKKLLERIHI